MVSVISIHALREEGDLDVRGALAEYIKFLSTPSARRATLSRARGGLGRFISIHALREEGDEDAQNQTVTYDISIHALREEGD